MHSHNVHEQSLATSTALSEQYVADLITPLQVISALNGAGVKFVLMGAHAIGGWMRKPRTTQDVDVLVGARHVKKAIRALLTAFPRLEADEHDIVVCLRHQDTKVVAVDVIKPLQDLFRAALKNTRTLEAGGQAYRIPSLEMALALKFVPMISLNREEEKKYIDAHDFITMIKANADLDLAKLAELGDLVYPGGGKELVEKVGQVRSGQSLRL
jgi:hypothetical protein